MWDPCAVALPWVQEQLYRLALGFCSALCRQDEHVGSETARELWRSRRNTSSWTDLVVLGRVFFLSLLVMGCTDDRPKLVAHVVSSPGITIPFSFSFPNDFPSDKRGRSICSKQFFSWNWPCRFVWNLREKITSLHQIARGSFQYRVIHPVTHSKFETKCQEPRTNY